LNPPPHTTFYYLSRSGEDALFSHAIQQKVDRSNHNLIAINHQSARSGRFDFESILPSKEEMKSCCVRVCGPKGLLKKLKYIFEINGLPNRQLVYEDFNYLYS